jgi:predicted nucleotidyltransferase
MVLKVIELNEKGTVYVLHGGMLTEVILSKIIYCPSGNDYEVKEIVVEHQGNEMIVGVDNIYSSIKDYTNRKPIELKSRCFNIAKGYYWNEETSQPEFYSATNEGCNLIYDYKTRKLIVDGYVPEDLFDSAEEVRLYYPIQVRNIDGTIESHGGVLTKLMLNDEEIQIVEELKQILRKLKEHNISFVKIDDYSYAFKSKDIKHFGGGGEWEYNITFLNKFRVKELEWEEGVNKGDWYDGLSVNFK